MFFLHMFMFSTIKRSLHWHFQQPIWMLLVLWSQLFSLPLHHKLNVFPSYARQWLLLYSTLNKYIHIHVIKTLIQWFFKLYYLVWIMSLKFVPSWLQLSVCSDEDHFIENFSHKTSFSHSSIPSSLSERIYSISVCRL